MKIQGMYISYAAFPLHLKEENILYSIFLSPTKYLFIQYFLLPEQVCQNFTAFLPFSIFCFFLSLCHPSFLSCFIYSFLIF